MARDRPVGIAFALLSATCFGVMPVLTKVVYRDGVGPVGVLALRFTVAAALLLTLARVRGERLPTGRVRTRLLLLGGVGYATQAACYFGALQRIGAGLAALLLYLFPALVVVLAAVLLGERARPAALVCVAAATCGTVLTVGPVRSGQVTGVLLGIGAAASYALYVVASSRFAAGTGHVATAAVVLSASALVYDVVAVATHAPLPHRPVAWLAVLGVALLGTAVAVTAFFAALERLGPSDASVVSTVEPVVSILVAAAVLGERLGPLQLAGGVLVLLAVVVLARLRPVRREQEAVPA